MEVTKKQLSAKGAGEHDHYSISRGFKEFCFGCKKLNYQEKSSVLGNRGNFFEEH